MSRRVTERDKGVLVTGADFEELPGVREVRGSGGVVTLFVDYLFVDAYREYFDADEGEGRERLTIGALVHVIVARPPLGQVRYMPTHSHPHQITCDAGCPVFDWERYVERHGSPYERQA